MNRNFSFLSKAVRLFTRSYVPVPGAAQAAAQAAAPPAGNSLMQVVFGAALSGVVVSALIVKSGKFEPDAVVNATQVVTDAIKDLPIDDHLPIPVNTRYDGDSSLGSLAYPKEMCPISYAPNVPPPITRKHPVILKLDITSDVYVSKLTNKYNYKFWGFDNHVPGPFIRTRVGDVLDCTLTNTDPTGMPHNIDFHSVTGPGGGAPVLLAESLGMKRAAFKLLSPGLFVYHCAAAPVPMHIANGMYGLILVEPENGLSPVDKEFYVMQSEFYFDAPEEADSNEATFSYARGLSEDSDAVVFNGRQGALTQDGGLKCKTGDRVRLYFGNGGPNLTSAFHVIGAVFDKVYREGDIVTPPSRGVQTTTVPPGGSCVVELRPLVPGNLTIVDHALFRLDKGCVGFINVQGAKRPDIYYSDEALKPCPGCKLHP